jgi:hypothetical protein
MPLAQFAGPRSRPVVDKPGPVERLEAGAIPRQEARTEPAAPAPPAPAEHLAARRIFLARRDMLSGVLARRDLLGVLLRPDDELRRRIELDVFRHALCADPSELDITVTDAVVTLTGFLSYRSDVASAGRLAGEILGVAAVRNRVRYRWDDTRD